MSQQGMVYLFEGDGKGKTSAALGVTVRMLLNEKRVVWISWFKSKDWEISESRLPEHFEKLEMFMAGEGFFLKDVKPVIRGHKAIKMVRTGKSIVMDGKKITDHVVSAKSALEMAKKFLQQENPPNLIVLDEIIRAVADGLLGEDEVVDLIKGRGATHMILTGHKSPDSIVHEADLVTTMNKRKHPYDQGVLAIKGLDF